MTQFGVQPRMAGSSFFPAPKPMPKPVVDVGRSILARVAREEKLTVEAICGRSHASFLVASRLRIAVALNRDYGWSMPRIGRLLGGRDHTTILNLLKTAKAMGFYDNMPKIEPATSRATSERLAALSDAYRVASECYQAACKYGVTGDAEAAIWAIVQREADSANKAAGG